MITRAQFIYALTFLIFHSLSAQETPSPSGATVASPIASPAPTATPSPGAPPLSQALFKNLKARSIGPAVMGGRVSDIAIDPRSPFVFYVGLGHGGVFKTNDNGVTFQPIFDKQPMLSIGALAVAPSDSDVVWVGSGETWQNIGLRESRTIARIVVDPKKPEVAYVAAMGNLWKDGGERGLFKTTDAGKTWKLILHAEAPHDARTGLAISASNPKIIMAVVQSYEGGLGTLVDLRSKSGGVFRSEDGGEKWTRASAMDPRP